MTFSESDTLFSSVYTVIDYKIHSAIMFIFRKLSQEPAFYTLYLELPFAMGYYTGGKLGCSRICERVVSYIQKKNLK